MKDAAFMPPSNIRRVSLLAERMSADAGAGDGYAARIKFEEQHKKPVEQSKQDFIDCLAKLIESVEW